MLFLAPKISNAVQSAISATAVLLVNISSTVNISAKILLVISTMYRVCVEET